MIINIDNKSNWIKRKVYQYIMLKLINDSCSSNADYRDPKRTFCEADIFAFLNVDHHGTGSVLF